MQYIKQYDNIFTDDECDLILSNRIKYSEVDGVLQDFIVFYDEADSCWKPIIENLKNKTKEIVSDYFKSFLELFPESVLDVSHIGFLNDKFGSFTEVHYDWEIVILKERIIPKPFVILIYLNDDFCGGELVFPLQDFKSTPKKGSIVIFPCNFAFPHLSTPITEGSKHLCRMTFKVPSEIFKVEALEI